MSEAERPRCPPESDGKSRSLNTYAPPRGEVTHPATPVRPLQPHSSPPRLSDWKVACLNTTGAIGKRRRTKSASKWNWSAIATASNLPQAVPSEVAFQLTRATLSSFPGNGATSGCRRGQSARLARQRWPTSQVSGRWLRTRSRDTQLRPAFLHRHRCATPRATKSWSFPGTTITRWRSSNWPNDLRKIRQEISTPSLVIAGETPAFPMFCLGSKRFNGWCFLNRHPVSTGKLGRASVTVGFPPASLAPA